MSNPKKHHYVPQFLLRQFAEDGREHVYVLDKKTGRTFRANIGDVAAQNRFYEFTIGEVTASLEQGLAEFESRAAEALRRTLSAGSLTPITILHRTILAALVAQLIIRTPHRQALGDDMIAKVREKIRSMGTDPDKLPELKILDANENKILTARMLSETWQEFIPLIAFKTWAFHPVPETETIYLSDNPVVMHNELDFGPRGNLGVDVKGIELYLPLSSNAVLGMYCPQMTADLQRRYQEMVSDHVFMERTMTPDTREAMETLFTGFRTGAPIPFDKANVEFINSLQVGRAERYVYAATDDFELAKDMLAKNPKLLSGPRASVV